MKMKDGEKMYAIYFKRGHCGNRPAKSAKEAVRLYIKDANIVGGSSDYKAIEAVAGIHYTPHTEKPAPPVMPAQKLTAQQIYDKLIYETNIVCSDGTIEVSLSDIGITEWHEQAIREILREWLRHWLKENNIAYSTNEDSAIPIDYHLCGADNPQNSIRVEVYQVYEKANYAIADFRTFAEELICTPSLLNTDYLVFQYGIDEDIDGRGNPVISDLLMRKIWQMTRPMKGYPLSLQMVNGKIRQIKSCDWNIKHTPKTFRTPDHFLCALEETIRRNPQTESMADTWRREFLAAYKKEYGKTIEIPQWTEIRNLYKT